MTESKPSTLLQGTSDSTLVLRRIAIGAIALICVTIWFANIGYRSLAEPDEGRYAEIAREMLASGDWVTPHLNAIPYLEKPPLQYWATALGYSVFGIQPWVARLWPATLGLLGILVTYATGRKLWGPRAGEFAALIAASCPLYFVIAHINILDIGVSFFMNAAMACFLLAQQGRPDRPAERHWMWLCWLALACGFLQKGLMALALPALTLLAYCLAYRHWQLWRRLHLRDGLIIVAVISLPWLLLVSARVPGFLQFFFVHEQFDRFATTVHRRTEPWWYFIGILAVGVLPWISVVARAIFHRNYDRRDEQGIHATALLLIWAAVIVVFFSLSGSKLAPYIVPVVPPLALVTGRWLQLRGTVRALWPVVIISGVFCALWLALEPLVSHFVAPGIKQTTYLSIVPWARAAGLLGAAGLAIALVAIRRGNLRLAVTALGASFSAALSVFMCGSNSLAVLRVKPGLAAAITPHLTADTSLYCVGMYWHTLTFDLQRTCTLVEYVGEIEVQFDAGQRHSLRGITEFLAQWQQEQSAVAIVDPDVWPSLKAGGLTARPVVQDDKVVVIVRP